MLDVRQSEHRCAEMTRIRRYERPSDHERSRVISPPIGVEEGNFAVRHRAADTT